MRRAARLYICARNPMLAQPLRVMRNDTNVLPPGLSYGMVRICPLSNRVSKKALRRVLISRHQSAGIDLLVIFQQDFPRQGGTGLICCLWRQYSASTDTTPRARPAVCGAGTGSPARSPRRDDCGSSSSRGNALSRIRRRASGCGTGAPPWLALWT